MNLIKGSALTSKILNNHNFLLKLEPRYSKILFEIYSKARNHHLLSVNSEEETEVVPTQTQEVEEQVEDQKDGDHEAKKEPEIKRVYTKEEADEIERVNINFDFHQMRKYYAL